MPLLSQIITVAETYDRVLNKGELPFKARKPATLNVIKNGAETQFDQQLSEIFVEMIEKSEGV